MKKNENRANTIGSRIRNARERADISQTELASLLGFQSATAISLIESDERGVSAPLLQRLGEVLRCDVKELLGQKVDLVDVQVALRADKDLSDEDKAAIERFIDLAKQKNNAR